MRWRVAVIDTENQSASLYQGIDGNDFDVIEIEAPYTVKKYVDAIHYAQSCGQYDVLLIDSLSHAWAAEGGIMEQKDAITASSRNKNDWAAWAELTPLQNQLMNALVQCKIHLIATMRSKSDWAIDNVDGKNKPRRIGLAPVQRAGLEYEFSVWGSFDADHNLTIEKSRVWTLEAKTYPSHELAEVTANIRDFHSTGEQLIPFDAPKFSAQWPTHPEWAGRFIQLAPDSVIVRYIEDRERSRSLPGLKPAQVNLIDLVIRNAHGVLDARKPTEPTEPPDNDHEPPDPPAVNEPPNDGDPWDDIDVHDH
jgi:hypothetical protein